MFGHVIHSLKNPTPERVAKVTHTVCGLFLVVGSLLGVCGYLSFFSDVDANILDNFNHHSVVNQVCRALLVVNVMAGVPYSTVC